MPQSLRLLLLFMPIIIVENPEMLRGCSLFAEQSKIHFPINRELLLLLLLGFFIHYRLEDYAKRGHEPTDDEIQIYTWPDATLRELADLVAEVRPEARGR